MASVAAICISEVRGIQKHEIPEAYFRIDHGIDGDAHAGNGHGQISRLSVESVARRQEELSFKLKNGDVAENVLVEGLAVSSLPVGTKLRIGEAVCEVTQIGKECHNDCAIRKAAGDCVMPREGIFVKVLESGAVKTGDEIKIEE